MDDVLPVPAIMHPKYIDIVLWHLLYRVCLVLKMCEKTMMCSELDIERIERILVTMNPFL